MAGVEGTDRIPPASFFVYCSFSLLFWVAEEEVFRLRGFLM